MKKHYGPLSVHLIEENRFKPEIATARIGQTVTSVYSSRNTASAGGVQLVPELDFELEAQTFDEKRIAFVPVPHKMIGQPELLKPYLDKYPHACIQKILSSEPIILASDNQSLTAINPDTGKPFRTIEDFKQSQLVMRPKLSNPADKNSVIPVMENGVQKTNSEGTPMVEMEPWPYNGQPQYRRLIFQLEQVADVDNRIPIEGVQRVQVVTRLEEPAQIEVV